jgi:hypothetical protein
MLGQYHVMELQNVMMAEMKVVVRNFGGELLQLVQF